MTDKSRIFIMAGTKSNVGKTTTAIYFSNVLTHLKIPHLDFDTDRTKTFSKFLHDKTTFLNIEDPSSVRKALAAIAQSKLKFCIIDLKSDDHKDAVMWLQDFLKKSKYSPNENINLIIPILAGKASITNFLQWYNQFKKDCRFIVVLNEVAGKNFKAYRKRTENWLKQDLPKELSIKRLDEEYSIPLDIKEISLYDFLYRDFEMPFRQFFGMIPYSRLLRYYKVIKWQIEEVINYEKE